MRIVVLGCGPAGLVAAWAAYSLGHDVTVMSDKIEPSTLYGCQYLHSPIPGFEDVPHTRVQYNLIGTPEQYRRKVYGNDWHGKVSPEDFIGEHDAWDIRETYRRLWAMFHDELPFKINGPAVMMIGRTKIRYGDIDQVLVSSPDKIISTIPAWDMCEQIAHHPFAAHVIYANGGRKPDGLPLDHVLCDGTEGCDWYRVSNVFGYRTVEWTAGLDKHPPEAVRVRKPLYNTCDCHPDVIRAGRYGKWEKGVLVHQVYNEVIEALNG